MNQSELKHIAENLIETFNNAGRESIELFSKGLKIEIKEDNSPVSNGDLRVNELITNKILHIWVPRNKCWLLKTNMCVPDGQFWDPRDPYSGPKK